MTKILLKTSHVPIPLRQGRTILIFKGKGSSSEISSWRPTTIYPIIRRLMEKVLDNHLRQQLDFHPSQRSFIKGMPGCHINARINAKANKNDGVIAFLDITSAFDNVGHAHIVRSLEARGISEDLKKTVIARLCNNFININLGISN